ncbi:MAG: DMT family transporter [Verrucomicrobia bacterium]|nr:DMT family transporter [Verrucomicrobiota bacterium]
MVFPGSAVRVRTIAFTLFALVAFAANSVLCRLALAPGAIDAASFSTVRLSSGAITLLMITIVMQRGSFRVHGSWISAAMLFSYAVPFSFAYLSLGAATGALILFGAVQATMMVAAIVAGERPHPWQWLGLFVALTGLVGLVLPGLTAPPLVGSALMAIAGISWGGYSLRGRGTADPLGDTTSNFLRSVPFVMIVSLFAVRQFHVTPSGILLAICSGALASALGYVGWYAALAGLTATRAAAVQLSVPVLAAVGGVAFLAEAVSLRLLVSAFLILGGVGLAVMGRKRVTDQH